MTQNSISLKSNQNISYLSYSKGFTFWCSLCQMELNCQVALKLFSDKPELAGKVALITLQSLTCFIVQFGSFKCGSSHSCGSILWVCLSDVISAEQN